MNIGTLTVMLGANTAGLTRAAMNMRRFESQVIGSNARIASSFEMLGAKMALTGVMMTQYFTVPLGLFAGATVKAFGDFEKELSKITGLVGVAGNVTAEWGQKMLSMAEQVGQTPKKLGEALYYITSSGLRGAESMGILKLSAQAATAGLGDTMTIADMVTSSMNAYGKENLTAAHSLDVFIKTIREGKGEPEEYARNLGKIFPISTKLGVSIEDVGASMAALTRTGTSVSEAATQVRRLLVTLIQQPPKAKEELEKLTGGILDFNKLISITHEEGLLQMLMQLKTFIDRNTTSLGDNMEAWGEIFPNIRALLPVLDMLGNNLEDTKGIFDSLNNSTGSFATLMSSTANTVNVRWHQSLASMGASLVKFGEALKEPVLRLLQALANMLSNLADWFTRLPKDIQASIVAFSGLLIVLGPVLLVLGQITTALRAIIPIMQATWVALAANPLAQTALAASAVIMLLSQMFNVMQRGTKTQQMFNDINVQAARSIAQEKVQIEQLLKIAKNANIDKEKRLEAIKELNAISPKYLGFINAETIATGEATDAVTKYIQKLRDKAKMQAASAKMVELEQRKLELQLDPSKSIDPNASFMDYILRVERSTKQQAENAKQEILGIQKQQTALQGMLDKLTYQETIESQITDEVQNRYDFSKSFGVSINENIRLGKKLVDIFKGVDFTKPSISFLNSTIPSTSSLFSDLTNYKGPEDILKAQKERMEELMTFMQFASGKALEGYAREWMALKKITEERQKAIDLATTELELIKAKPAQLQSIKSSGLTTSGKNWSILKPMETIDTKVLVGMDKRVAQNNLYTKSFEDINTVTVELNSSLAFLDEKQKALGASTELTANRTDVLYTAVDGYLFIMAQAGQGTGAWIMANEKLKETLNLIGETVDDNSKRLQLWSNVFRNVGSLANTVGKYLGETFQKVFQVISDIVGAVSSVLQIIKNVGKLTEKTTAVITTAQTVQTTATNVNTGALVANTVASEVNAAAKQQNATGDLIDAGAKGINTAATQVNTLAKIGNAIASAVEWLVKTLGPIGLIGAAAAITGIIALISSGSKRAKGATQMATGGVIPPGYPNDTFPALLSSGEAVIPLNRQKDLFSNGFDRGRGLKVKPITLKVEGRDLKAVLDFEDLISEAY